MEMPMTGSTPTWMGVAYIPKNRVPEKKCYCGRCGEFFETFLNREPSGCAKCHAADWSYQGRVGGLEWLENRWTLGRYNHGTRTAQAYMYNVAALKVWLKHTSLKAKKRPQITSDNCSTWNININTKSPQFGGATLKTKGPT